MPISFDYWLQAFRRHRKASLVSFFSILAITLCIVLFAPRRYASEASVMLRIGRESVTLDPTATTVGETLNLHHTRENEIQSAIGVMRSREIIERVVDVVGEGVVLRGKPDGGEGGFPGPMAMVSGILKPVKYLVASVDPVPDRQRAIRKLSLGLYLNSKKTIQCCVDWLCNGLRRSCPKCREPMG